MTKPEDVRIELNSQVGTSHDPATIKVYVGENLVSEVVASIEQQRGADGGLYPCVVLKEKLSPDSRAKLSEMLMFRFHLLAAAPPEEVSDKVVETAMMSLEINSLEDVHKVYEILKRTRPELIERTKGWLTRKNPNAAQ